METSKDIVVQCDELFKKYGKKASLLGKIALKTLVPHEVEALKDSCELIEFTCNQFAEKADDLNSESMLEQYNTMLAKIGEDQEFLLHTIAELNQKFEVVFDDLSLAMHQEEWTEESLSDLLLLKIQQSADLIKVQEKIGQMAYDLSHLRKQIDSIVDRFDVQGDLLLQNKEMLKQILVYMPSIGHQGEQGNDQQEISFLRLHKSFVIEIRNQNITQANLYLSQMKSIKPSSPLIHTSEALIAGLEHHFESMVSAIQLALKQDPSSQTLIQANNIAHQTAKAVQKTSQNQKPNAVEQININPPSQALKSKKSSDPSSSMEPAKVAINHSTNKIKITSNIGNQGILELINLSSYQRIGGILLVIVMISILFWKNENTRSDKSERDAKMDIKPTKPADSIVHANPTPLDKTDHQSKPEKKLDESIDMSPKQNLELPSNIDSNKPNHVKNFASYLSDAQKQFEQKLFEEAAKNIDQALALESKNEQALILGAKIFMELAKDQRVIDLANSVITLNPKNEDAYLYLGVSYQNLKDSKSAIKIYEEYLKLNPKNENKIEIIYLLEQMKSDEIKKQTKNNVDSHQKVFGRSLSQDEFKRTISSRSAKLIACIEKETVANPNVKKFFINMTIEPTGKILDATLSTGSINGIKCILKALQGLTFSPFDGGNYKATIPFELD